MSKMITLSLMAQKTRRVRELNDKIQSANDDVKRWAAECEKLYAEVQDLALRLEDGNDLVEVGLDTTLEALKSAPSSPSGEEK